MEHGIHSLHEFMLHTKNQLYPLAAIFLFSLLGFWIYLTGNEKDEPEGKAAGEATTGKWGQD